jgi:hypothetical protein
LSDSAWKERAETPLTKDEEESLQAFLYSRYHHPVGFDMRTLHRYTGETERFRAKYGLEPEKAVMGHHVASQLGQRLRLCPMAYPSFDDWIIDTIEQVERIPQVQWLIKIHPAEASFDPEVGVDRLIAARFRAFRRTSDHSGRRRAESTGVL